jgi:hypothetical protein
MAKKCPRDEHPSSCPELNFSSQSFHVTSYYIYVLYIFLYIFGVLIPCTLFAIFLTFYT